MAWYSGILNAAANPAAQQALSATGTVLNTTSTGTSPLSNMYPGGVVSIGTASTQYDPTSTITAYAKAIGWTVEHFYLPEGVDSNDPKVALLKLAKINEVIKDVGVRTASEHYFIMRDPNASE